MNTFTVVGQAVHPRGDYQQYDLAGTALPGRCRPEDYAEEQTRDLPLLVGHDPGWRLGTIEHIERSKACGLMVVARCHPDVADLLDGADWYLSPGLRAVASSPVTRSSAHLEEVSLTQTPAGLGLAPVVLSHSDIALDGGGQPRAMPVLWRSVWDRARESMTAQRWKRSDTIDVFDVDWQELRTRAAAKPKPPPLTTVHRRAAPPPPVRKPLLHFMGAPVYDEDRAERILEPFGWAIINGRAQYVG